MKTETKQAIKWRFVESNSPGIPAEIETADGLPICHVYGCEPIADSSCKLSPPHPDCLARAHLIARAPDLLAENERLRRACESALKVFQAWVQDCDPHNEMGTGESADRDAASQMYTMMFYALNPLKP